MSSASPKKYSPGKVPRSLTWCQRSRNAELVQVKRPSLPEKIDALHTWSSLSRCSGASEYASLSVGRCLDNDCHRQHVARQRPRRCRRGQLINRTTSTQFTTGRSLAQKGACLATTSPVCDADGR